MQPFNFSNEQTTSSAMNQYRPQSSEYLAGGTTLIDLMKLHVMTPSELVDLTTLPLKKITDLGDKIQIDAMVTNNEMAHHDLVKKHFPFVSEALLSGASVQLRNLATTSGNILQKTRCSYYRDLSARCNKREPGTGCDAVGGVSRMHAIVGVNEHCIASHPSDLCVALMASDAKILTEFPQGKREINFADFFTLPGDTPHIENVLAPGEIITSVQIPKHSWFKNSVYVKIRDRSSYAFALTSAAVALEFHGGVVKDARIVIGGVGPHPWRVYAAETVLVGSKLTREKMKEAAKAALTQTRSTTQNAFKIPLAEQTIIRALEEVEKKS